MNNSKKVNLRLLFTTALAGSVLLASTSNAELLKRAPERPSIEINFSAISKLRGTQEFSIYKNLDSEKKDEPILAKKPSVSKPSMKKKEVKPVVIKAELPKTLVRKAEKKAEIKVIPQLRPNVPFAAPKVVLRKARPFVKETPKEKTIVKTEKTDEIKETTSVELDFEQGETAPIDIINTPKVPVEKKIATAPKKAMEIPLNKLQAYVGGQKNDEVAAKEDNSAPTPKDPPSFFDKIAKVSSELFAGEPAGKEMTGEEEGESDIIIEKAPEQREVIKGSELEELDIENEEAPEDEAEESRQELAEIEDEPLKELMEKPIKKEKPAPKKKKLTYYGEGVQIILPDEIDSADPIFVIPEPKLRPFDVVSLEGKEGNVAKKEMPEPAIPEPAEVIEISKGPSISLRHKDVKEIDQNKWNEILNNAKEKAQNIEVSDPKTEKTELAKKLEAIKSVAQKDKKEIEVVSKKESEIEVNNEQEVSVIESIMQWMPAFNKGEKKAEITEVETYGGSEKVVEIKKVTEVGDGSSPMDLAVNVEEIEPLKVEESKEPMDLYKVTDDVAAISPVESAFNNVVEEEESEPAIPELAENTPLKLEDAKKAKSDDKMAEEFELTSLPQVEEAIDIPKQTKMLEPMVNGALLSINFNAEEVDISSFDKDRVLELIQQIKDTDKNVKIVSYAPEIEGEVASARRVSLKRAIAIRANMIEAGLDSIRINVQAVGNSAEVDSQANSVNIFLIENEAS